MNYVRTNSGSMMAITPKTTTVISVKKQTAGMKQIKKSAINTKTGTK